MANLSIIRKLLENNRAESPIEVILTIMIGLILMTGVIFAEGTFLDGFIYLIERLPPTLQPTFQGIFNSLMDLGSIFFAIPAFFGAVLIVWGAKTIIRRHGYSRVAEEIYYDDSF